MNGLHVVFGATGSLGAAVVRRLAQEGKHVRAVVRDPAKARDLLPAQAEIALADALDRDQTRAASQGASVVYHCINVPYPRWTDIMPRIADNILAAAAQRGAVLLFPGNVYGYGRLQRIPAAEDHPKAAATKKGRLRNSLEERLLAAHNARELRVVIPRFPDYYGPNVLNRFIAPIFEAALTGKKAVWIGNLDAPHDLVFIEDAAHACVLLAATERAHGQQWHVPGPGPLTGRQFLTMAFQAAGAAPKIGAMTRFFFRLASLFNAEARELIELLYEFEEPLVLDGSKFSEAFHAFAYTPHPEAIRRTLDWFRARAAAPTAQPKAS